MEQGVFDQPPAPWSKDGQGDQSAVGRFSERGEEEEGVLQLCGQLDSSGTRSICLGTLQRRMNVGLFQAASIDLKSFFSFAGSVPFWKFLCTVEDRATGRC